MQQFQQEITMSVNQPKSRSIVGPFVLIAVSGPAIRQQVDALKSPRP